MPVSQQITEIVVFHLKEGVKLENVASSNSSQAVQGFIQLTNIIKAQQGFIRHFWGHEVEHPKLFVWSIDWESFEHHTTFISSEQYILFKAGLSQVFDMNESAPITLYTRVSDNEAATAAFRSPVTEVAFFTMPTQPDAETRAAIEEASQTVLREVQTIGKASGAAIGWVFDAVPRAIVSGADSVSLYGVFGYASIDVHMRWRETPEGKKHGQPSTTTLPATVVPGIDASTGYFHVEFCEGL